MSDQIPPSNPSNKWVIYLVLLILLLSLGANCYFLVLKLGKDRQKVIKPPDSNPTTNINSQVKDSTEQADKLPIPALSTAIQDVKVVYEFKVRLDRIATESAKTKLITYTAGGTNFNYLLNSQTKIVINDKESTSSVLKIGQELFVKAEYNPRNRSWMVTEVKIL